MIADDDTRSDKGKSGESWRRKAMGLHRAKNAGLDMIARLPKRLLNVAPFRVFCVRRGRVVFLASVSFRLDYRL